MDDAILDRLAREHGTPLYVYDRREMVDRWARLQAALAPGMRLYYAIKANPLLEVLRVFLDRGCGAEVASQGELELALAAGFSPDAIAYTCPGKTRAAVELAVRAGVGVITVENDAEAVLIDEVARARGRRQAVIVRVNPLGVGASSWPRMSGVPSQFGVDVEVFGAFMAGLAGRDGLRVVGVHVYTGTQILDASALVEDARLAVETSLELSGRHGFELEVVDIGGGFGVAYQGDDARLDLGALGRGYAALFAGPERRVDAERVIVESGRYLTAPAGVFLTRALATKRSRGVTFVICDGGYAQHSASLHIARTGHNRHRVEALGGDGPRERVTVVGPTGTPIDILAREVSLPRVEVGDLLVVRDVGAYGYTNASQLFFSEVSPAELFVDAGRVEVLRARGSFVDLAHDRVRRSER